MPRAQRDLLSLYHRIGARSSDAALNWYRGLRKAIRSLRDNPRRSPVTPENPGVRHLLYGDKPHVYRVIYRVLAARGKNLLQPVTSILSEASFLYGDGAEEGS
jgi:plasmid stabilization system protein ParE